MIQEQDNPFPSLLMANRADGSLVFTLLWLNSQMAG